MELFDAQLERMLHRDVVQLEGMLHRDVSRDPKEHCREVLHHWLRTDVDPTWNKLIKSLESTGVNLTYVADTIKRMLDNHVSYSYSIMFDRILKNRSKLPM